MQPYTVEELEFINRGATANTKEIEMFDTDEFIDTVQSAKKTMVKTFVQNETIAKSMNAFVDAKSASCQLYSPTFSVNSAWYG